MKTGYERLNKPNNNGNGSLINRMDRKPGMEEKVEELDGFLKGIVKELHHLLKLCKSFKRNMSMKRQSSGRPHEDLSFRWA